MERKYRQLFYEIIVKLSQKLEKKKNNFFCYWIVVKIDAYNRKFYHPVRKLRVSSEGFAGEWINGT